jgi:glycosyltransferase involved in cell wall biosynthesis
VARPLTFPDPTLSLAVMTPPPLPLYAGVLESQMTAIIAARVRGAYRRLGLDDPIVIVTLPSFARVAFRLPHASVVYNRSDRHSAFAGADAARIGQFEDLLFSSADAILYSNSSLHRCEAPALRGRAHLIGHGTDTEMFRPDGPQAPELAHLPRPRAGFFGDIRRRALDLDLVAAVADLCPDVQFVLGGPQLDDLSALRARRNIAFVDACPHERMPERWRALDVAILPYGRNDWTEAIEPIKLIEIIATGLPVVGTSIPALRERSDIGLADDPVALAAALRRALAGPRDAASRVPGANAAAPPWEVIADRILTIVDAAAQD